MAARILLTGFEPFSDLTVNPSQLLVEEIQIQSSAEVFKHILAVNFEQAVPIYKDILEAVQPDLILNIGFSAKAFAIQLEQFALNSAFDAEQLNQHRLIIDGGVAAYRSDLDAAKLAVQLAKQGIPAQRSDYAGIYLCNFIYYHSMHWFAQNGKAQNALFLHIPLSSRLSATRCLDMKRAYPSMPIEQLSQAVNYLIDWYMLERRKLT